MARNFHITKVASYVSDGVGGLNITGADDSEINDSGVQTQIFSPASSAPTAVLHYTSEIDEMLHHHPIALSWRYGSRDELKQAVFDKHFGLPTALKRLDRSQEIMVPLDGDKKPVVYVEQSDGSVVYESYLDKINEQAQGRTDPLSAYAFKAEMLNDFAAIKLQQLVELDGVRVWPPLAQTGFGPALPYSTQADGTIAYGRSASNDITIKDI